MHSKRLVIAIILVPLLYLYVMYLPPEYFLLMLSCFSTVGLAEFYAFSGVRGAVKYSGLFFGVVLLAVFFFAAELFAAALVLSVLVITGVRLFSQRDPARSTAEVSAAVFGLLYLPVLLSVQLDLIKTGPGWIILLYSSVWASDSMAYYAGKGLGKRKLYKEISPNKTVAGAVGSVIGGVAGAALIRSVLFSSMPVLHACTAGLAIGISTIIGDLAESMFKRDAGVKDSGGIVPGHGGVLDKLDGVTFAGPVFYWVSKGLGILG